MSKIICHFSHTVFAFSRVLPYQDKFCSHAKVNKKNETPTKRVLFYEKHTEKFGY